MFFVCLFFPVFFVSFFFFFLLLSTVGINWQPLESSRYSSSKNQNQLKNSMSMLKGSGYFVWVKFPRMIGKIDFQNTQRETKLYFWLVDRRTMPQISWICRKKRVSSKADRSTNWTDDKMRSIYRYRLREQSGQRSTVHLIQCWFRCIADSYKAQRC